MPHLFRSLFLIPVSAALGMAGAALAQTPSGTADSGLTSLSVPHVHSCQQGFERLFGIPQGADPDEGLIIRGARQTLAQRAHQVETPDGGIPELRHTLEIAMPYERVLPPGPPEGAVIPGRITCRFIEAADGSFALTPDSVVLEEEGVARRLDDRERALFR